MWPLLLLLAALLPLSGADWVRLRAPGIELLTDAGEKTGQETLDRLLRVRGLFQHSPGARDMRVVLFSSEREYAALAPSKNTSGFFQSGPERDSILLHAGNGAGRTIVHEYVHALLHQGPRILPAWFEEGMAEFYSTLEISKNRLVIGAPIASHIDTLARRRMLSPSELMAETKPPEQDVFYAQSWALVHMLNLDPRYRQGMARFAESSDFFDAFQRTPEQAMQDLAGYYRGARSVTIDGEPAVGGRQGKPETLPALDALLRRAELALHTGHVEPASRYLDQAARAFPGSPEVTAALGMLARYQGDAQGARQRLENAIGAGSTNAEVWFEYAMVEREAGASPERVTVLLKKVIALNPDFCEAQFMLGVRATDAGDLVEAMARLRDAVRVMPRKSSFWSALAFAQQKAGDRTGAAESARRAVRTAESPEEAGMASTLLESLR